MGLAEKNPDITDIGTPTVTRTAAQLPNPKGYKILIGLPEVSEETVTGRLIIPEDSRKIEEVATVVGFVMEIGSDAYKDKDRYPSGAYCAVGDFVVFRAFSGTRLSIHGKEFRLINDDCVEAVV